MDGGGGGGGGGFGLGGLQWTAEEASTIGGIATVSLLHSFIPTHWLPFSIVARAQRWPLSRTLLVTAFGGVLHVVSTALLGITAVTMAMLIIIQWRRWQLQVLYLYLHYHPVQQLFQCFLLLAIHPP
jgi:hypothetical protein